MRLPRTRGDVPLDLPDVVLAGLVEPNLGELGAVAERRGPVLAGEEALDPPAHGEVERAKQRLRNRARARSRRRPLERDDAQALASRARSMRGRATAPSTASMTESGDTS